MHFSNSAFANGQARFKDSVLRTVYIAINSLKAIPIQAMKNFFEKVGITDETKHASIKASRDLCLMR